MIQIGSNLLQFVRYLLECSVTKFTLLILLGLTHKSHKFVLNCHR